MTAPASGRFDIAIAGAGVVGLSLALAIRRATALPVRIGLFDPSLAAPPRRTMRAVAVTDGVRAFLEGLGVWQAVEDTAQPMTAMALTDAPRGGTPAPVFLGFSGEAAPDTPFAHMIFQDDLRDALLAACRDAGFTLEPQPVTDATPTPGGMTFHAGQSALRTRLLVAADGDRSTLRERAGIRTLAWDYGQSAVIATLAHERDHGGRATQHFLPGGPLALLPLRAADRSGRRSSLVWTEQRAEAIRLAALRPDAFVAELTARAGLELGAFRLEDQPRAIPLRLSLARSFHAPRLALAGDAAHRIHPLAGQGLNVGLGDAETLARLVSEALRLGLDPGAPGLLATYGRLRRPEAVALGVATDALNRLFSNDSTPLRLLRDFGLGLVDRAPALKQFLIRSAAGIGRPAEPVRPPASRPRRDRGQRGPKGGLDIEV